MNGKQQAKPKHIERFAEALQVSPNLLYKAAGSAALDSKQPEDILYSVDDAIQDILKSYLSEQQYTKGRVEQELKNYEQYAETLEGQQIIHEQFAAKIQQVDSSGPFIEHLKLMYSQFSNEDTPSAERAVLGSALLYFILSTDIIPDYIFPIGYLDDAIAVQMVLNKLASRKEEQDKT